MTDSDRLREEARNASMAAHDAAVLARLARGETIERPAPIRNAMLARDKTGTLGTIAAVRRFARATSRRRAA